MVVFGLKMVVWVVVGKECFVKIKKSREKFGKVVGFLAKVIWLLRIDLKSWILFD